MNRGRQLLLVFALAGFGGIAALRYVAANRQDALQRDLQKRRAQHQDVQFRDAYLRSEAARHDAAGIRLTEVEPFPMDERKIVSAVIGALGRTDAKPEQYLATVKRSNGEFQVGLRHESDHADYAVCGDACGKCRVAVYDPRSGTVRINGIR